MKALLLIAALTLAACSNDTGSQAEPDDEPVEAVTEPDAEPEADVDVVDEQLDGVHPDDLNPSVGPTEAVEQYDGLAIRLASLEQVPTSRGADVPANHALVKVTLELENTSEQPVPLESPMSHMSLLHGPNLQEASRNPGYMADNPEDELSSDVPRQVGAGETIAVFYTFEVPEDQLDELAVEATVEPERYGPVIFADAHTLL